MWGLVSRLRHGPFRELGVPWRLAGRAYRAFQDWTGLPASVPKRIGPYGPFRLVGRFAFSNFETWGSAHNAGFVACIEACRGRHCVFDLGAHIGLVTLPAASVMASGGRLYAFEPAAANLTYLREHLSLNAIHNVDVVETLVGAENWPDVPFFEQAGDSPLNTQRPRAGAAGFVESRHRQVSLDSFCAERGLRPEIIKIDVEGAELSVLQGAHTILAQARPTVFLSVHPRHLREFGASADDLLAFIGAMGYVAQYPDGGIAESLEFAEYELVPEDRC